MQLGQPGLGSASLARGIAGKLRDQDCVYQNCIDKVVECLLQLGLGWSLA